MSTYGIGGTEVKPDTNEAISEIAQNRTLLIEKLTTESPVKPEIVSGMKTLDDLFDHFKPHVEVEFEATDGSVQKENLLFRNLGDFGLKGVTNQSNYLGDLTTEKEQYYKIIKVLKTNKILKSALTNPDAKAALISAIQGLIAELEQSDKNN